MDYIRDTRDQVFMVNDEYLNGYARLCGINATGVYISLCRHVDKKQTCFPSKKLISEELAISERSVHGALLILEKWGIIKIEHKGRREDGSFKNNTYILIDKKHWKPKNTIGKLCRRQTVPSAGNDSHHRHVVPNKDTHKKDTHLVEAPPQEGCEEIWDTNAYREAMVNNPRRPVHIVGLYWSIKAIGHPTKKAAESALKRDLKAASQLQGYPDEQIIAVMKWLNKNADYDWKLETVFKSIDGYNAVNKK